MTPSAETVLPNEIAPSTKKLAACGVLVLIVTGSTPLLFVHLGDNFFIAQALLCGALVMVATSIAERCPERQGLAVILGLAVLLRLVLLVAPPLNSGDVYRYVWDGRLQAAGFNPFSYVPAAPELRFLRDAVIYPNLDRADYAVTIYPPVAQMFFFLVTRVHESVLAMKLAFVACEAVTIAAVIALLRRLHRPVTRVVAYAWHPLVLWEIANNGHLDAGMAALMMLAVWLFAAGHRLAAVAAATFAALFKLFAVLILPALWRPWDWKGPLLAVVLVAALYLPYLSAGTGVLGFLPGYFGEERIDSGGAFWVVRTLRWALGPAPLITPLYIGASLVILLTLALRAAFRRDRPLETTLGDINALLLAFCFLLSPDYPWYFLMVVPFVALTGSWPGWVLTIGGFMLYDVVPWDPYVPFHVRNGVFNLAILAAALMALYQARVRRVVGPSRGVAP